MYTYPGAAELEADPTLCMEDADEDGYGGEAGSYDDFVSGTDCDDSSAFAYPGAAELEADPTLCMEDADEDGYGGEAGSYDDFESGTDCDDDDAALNPDIDGDADGFSSCVDCDDADGAVGEASLTGYEDIDGDGYGSGDMAMVCSLDEDGDGIDDYVSMGGDCYDSSWSSSSIYIYPGAAYNEPDIDGDGVDDCTEDSDGDGYGDMSSYYADVAGTDCDDDDEFTFPGAGYMEVSPLDEQCLTDADEDGYAVGVSGLYEMSVTSGDCFVVEMTDQYSDGCGAFADMYIDGMIDTSIVGPAYGDASEETEWCASTTGFWQVGWTEDSSWNSDCELYVYDSTGAEIYGSGSGTISGTIPGGGTDSDDTDATVQ
jgi:hypothetical protein